MAAASIAAHHCAVTSIDDPSRQTMCKQSDAGHAEKGRTSASSIFTVLPCRQPQDDNCVTAYTIPSHAPSALMCEVTRFVVTAKLEQARAHRRRRLRAGGHGRRRARTNRRDQPTPSIIVPAERKPVQAGQPSRQCPGIRQATKRAPFRFWPRRRLRSPPFRSRPRPIHPPAR